MTPASSTPLFHLYVLVSRLSLKNSFNHTQLMQAAKAERDAAELAETLRLTLENMQGARTPRMGTFYEQGSAELARAGGW